jgi:hypothetical protein
MIQPLLGNGKFKAFAKMAAARQTGERQLAWIFKLPETTKAVWAVPSRHASRRFCLAFNHLRRPRSQTLP